MAQTLYDNLERLREDEELVLLDYGSQDGLGRYIQVSQRCKDAITNGKLVYVYAEANSYHCPKAKNLAHRLASGEFLVNLDADNSNEQMREAIDKTFYEFPDSILHMDDQMHRGAYGRICLPRHWFYKLGGYDESLLPSAYQDTDLIERAKAIGLRYVLAPTGNSIPLHNTTLEKALFTGHQDWWEMKKANKATSELNLEKGNITANINGWGGAQVQINFAATQVLTALSPYREAVEGIRRPHQLPRIRKLPTASRPVRTTSPNRISVVMLSWNRLENVYLLVEKYNCMQLIGEVIVINNNPNVTIKQSYPKMTVINASRDLGLFSRFAVAALTMFPSILLTDDDIYLPEETLIELHRAWRSDPLILHGISGRNTNSAGYSRQPAVGACEIVLTRGVLTSAKTCIRALSYASRFNSDLGGDPKGNGEDILLSFVASKSNNRLNMVYSLPTEELPAPESIHHRIANHFEHRSAVVQWCRQNVL